VLFCAYNKQNDMSKTVIITGGTKGIGLESQQACIDTVVDRFGQVDVMIANAGVGHFAPIEEMSIEDWSSTIDTNLTGVFYSTKVAIPELKKTEGYLITIASLAGTNFFAKGSAYNASKFGLVGFTQSVMLDLRQYGIKTTTIMPGSVSTHFNDHTPSEATCSKCILVHFLVRSKYGLLSQVERNKVL